jgi:hypothetical protein
MPKATRPSEYVFFFPFDVPTNEGEMYVYIAIDSYSKFIFKTGIERVLNDDMILKHIGLLMEHKDFKRHSDKGFTLVFHKYADYQNHLDEIIKPYGKFIIDDAWMSKEIAPVMESFFKGIPKP